MSFNPIITYNFELAAAAAGNTVPPEAVFNRNPANTDTSGPSGSFAPGQLWFSTATQSLFVLNSLTGGIAVWAQVPSATGTISTLTGNSGGPIMPIAGNINLVGTGAISVAGSGNTLTISSAVQAFGWTNNATSGALASNHGYIITSGAQTFSLPAAPAIGDIIKIILNGGTSWEITFLGAQGLYAIPSTSPVFYNTSIISNNTNTTALSMVCVVDGGSSRWAAESLIGSIKGT